MHFDACAVFDFAQNSPSHFKNPLGGWGNPALRHMWTHIPLLERWGAVFWEERQVSATWIPSGGPGGWEPTSSSS